MTTYPRARTLEALRTNWREYLIEAGALGFFMLAACAVGVLLEHPESPVPSAIANSDARRALGGVAMGLTAIAIVYSPWGRRSGAHINPAFTLTFLRLGKVTRHDALFYVAAQFAGAVAGVQLARAAAGALVGHPKVFYAATVPGPAGSLVAFAAEAAITFVLMLVVLSFTNAERLAPFTGLAVGALVAIYITVEAPLSGMSMNPARTFGSTVAAGRWSELWIYFTAPPLGMLAAAETYRRVAGADRIFCAKHIHDRKVRCLFCEARDRNLPINTTTD